MLDMSNNVTRVHRVVTATILAAVIFTCGLYVGQAYSHGNSNIAIVPIVHAQGTSTRTSVWNEIPLLNASGNWTLKQYPAPADAVECFYGGLHQTANKDYTLRGLQLYSTIWSPSDISGNLADLVCNYTY